MADENHAETISNLTIAAGLAGRGILSVNAKDGREFLALPDSNDGYDLKEITPFNSIAPLPSKVLAAKVLLQTTESMVNYVNRFKNDDSVLFADIDTNTIVGMIDYHIAPGEQNPDATAKPPVATHNSHRATLTLPYSQEWRIWNGSSGKLMSHKDFASFLEENNIDITAPKGADLLELCRDLQVISNVNFSSAVRDGDYVEIGYAKEADASSKGGVKLPTMMTIQIPVYFGEKAVEVTAFLRRKIEDNKLFLGYSLSRVENVRQREFQDIVEGVTEGVDHLTTVYGKPS